MKRDLVFFCAGLLAGGLVLAGCGQKSTPSTTSATPNAPATSEPASGQVAPSQIAGQPAVPSGAVHPSIPRPAAPLPQSASAASGAPSRPVPARPRDERQDEVPIVRELRRSLADVEVESDDDRKSIGAMLDAAEPQLRGVLGKNSLRAIQQANQRMPFVVIEPPRKPAAKPANPSSPSAPSSPTPAPTPTAPAGE
ncbi:MAG: hypothetical protein K2Y37_20280 [Pirellulales bacterium]|nr:hypothetical protein [Pirellulales bacterium]